MAKAELGWLRHIVDGLRSYRESDMHPLGTGKGESIVFLSKQKVLILDVYFRRPFWW